MQVILFFFGLVNAGVEVTNAGAGTWIVLAAMLLGKPIGIVSATALSGMVGLHRPTGVSWRDLSVIGVTAGIGFTVALFFSTAAFPRGGDLLDQTKMGALLSFSAAALAVALAWLCRAGRFANSQNRTH